MSSPILPGAKIGILGGGQLGRMLTLEAKRMGYFVVILDPSENSPAGQVADEQIVAALDDRAAFLKLSTKVQVITYEFENVDVEAVEELEQRGCPVFPSSQALKISQDRILEKEFLRKAGVPVTSFCAVSSLEDLEKAGTEAGFPAFLKTTRGGYDGKGQWAASSFAQATEGFRAAAGRPLIFEHKVEFTKELSVLVARNAKGQVVTYPATENIHKNNILDLTIAPARVPAQVLAEAAQIGTKVAEALELVGVICLELFLLADGTLLANEIAPRPHNSGHYTLDACLTSQFAQQLRAVCGLPLGEPTLICQAVMLNILGSGQGDRLRGVEQVLKLPGARLHIYGKSKAASGRKMGHLTILGQDQDNLLTQVEKARTLLHWSV